MNKVNMTQEEFMREKGFVILIKEGERYKEWIKRFADLNPKIIYSMWEGYIDPKMKAYNEELAEFLKPYAFYVMEKLVILCFELKVQFYGKNTLKLPFCGVAFYGNL